MHLGIQIDTDQPQQKQDKKNLVIKISKIVGIKIEKHFPLWIADIILSCWLQYTLIDYY